MKIEYGLDALVALASLDSNEEFEWDYVRKDGTKFPALLAVSALRDEENRVTGYMGIIQDLTAKREAEAEKNRLLKIVETSPGMICFGEPGGPILYQNKAGDNILGLSKDESIVGSYASSYQPEWARKKIVEEALPALQEFGFWEGETAVLHRDGHEVPVSQVLMTLPTNPGEPTYVATIVRDITQAKAFEAQLKQQGLELLRSNEELEQFAFIASHDLQEPFAAS
jgi:PAS domain S-box-containing protein